MIINISPRSNKVDDGFMLPSIIEGLNEGRKFSFREDNSYAFYNKKENLIILLGISESFLYVDEEMLTIKDNDKYMIEMIEIINQLGELPQNDLSSKCINIKIDDLKEAAIICAGKDIDDVDWELVPQMRVAINMAYELTPDCSLIATADYPRAPNETKQFLNELGKHNHLLITEHGEAKLRYYNLPKPDSYEVGPNSTFSVLLATKYLIQSGYEKIDYIGFTGRAEWSNMVNGEYREIQEKDLDKIKRAYKNSIKLTKKELYENSIYNTGLEDFSYEELEEVEREIFVDHSGCWICHPEILKRKNEDEC